MFIHLPFKKLSNWQRRAFAAALLERMLPNYRMFAEAFEFGQYPVLRNQLDLIWQKLSGQPCKLNVEVQQEKLEAEIPDVEQFDCFGVYPALDAAMALSSALQLMVDAEPELCQQISQLSENSVIFYLETLSQQEDEVVSEDLLKAHPLMAWEIATQNELFDSLKTAKENKATCQKLKALVTDERLSNLGIEY